MNKISPGQGQKSRIHEDTQRGKSGARAGATGKKKTGRKPLDELKDLRVKLRKAEDLLKAGAGELKKAQGSLMASEEKYRELFNNSLENIVIYELVYDDQGAITDWVFRDANPGAIADMERPWDDIVGKRASEIYGSEAMASYFEISRQVMSTGKPKRFESHSLDHKKYFLTTAFPFGKNMFVTAGADITELKLTEKALRESEERLRLATNAANEAIWDWDLADGTVKWNNTYTVLFGREPGTGSSSDWWADRIHPEDRERVVSSMLDAIKTGAESWIREYRMLKADGSWAEVYDRAYIAHDESGKAKRIVGAMLDITEEKGAQEALRKSHEDLEIKVQERTAELKKAYELLKRIFASITVHIAYMDRDFNYISVNPAYAEADEQISDFFVGKNYFDLYPNEENSTIFKRVVETGEPYVVYEKPFVSALHPDRGVTYWDWSLQPVKDADGEVSGVMLSSVNVTDRKHAEENSIRLAAAIESAADAVVISDVRGFIQYVNPAFEKITGYGKHEALGRDQHMLDGGKHDEVFFRELRETMRRDGFWKGRLLNKKKDGTLYNEECTYSPIKNPSGEIINYVSIKRDVTEKLWLESVAQSVDTMNNIGYIFAGVRHEIGNPVNAVNMILEVLKSKLARLEKPAIEGYLDRALSELSRVEYLLRTLKNYNMYERPQLQNISLNDFMKQFLSVVKEDFRSKGINITVSIDPDTEFCYADPRALQQILLNFLTNASDALEGRENPAVAISAFKKGSMIRIRVEDNGCGMTEEEQKALFKPFYTTKAKGTGLGLVIVKKMLTMMKGTIEITSRKNSGTIVDVAVLDGSRNESASSNYFSKEVKAHGKEE